MDCADYVIAVYLYHVMMAIFLERTFTVATSWLTLGVLFGAYIALTFSAATLSYYFVEAPVLRWRNRVYPE
jgi:peptidoglycan/LPS O-acetylase OafA/YrhL